MVRLHDSAQLAEAGSSLRRLQDLERTQPGAAEAAAASRVRRSLAKMLRAIRHAAGLSTTELATRMDGITQPRISQLEGSKENALPNLETVQRFAKGCGAEIALVARIKDEIHVTPLDQSTFANEIAGSLEVGSGRSGARDVDTGWTTERGEMTRLGRWTIGAGQGDPNAGPPWRDDRGMAMPWLVSRSQAKGLLEDGSSFGEGARSILATLDCARLALISSVQLGGRSVSEEEVLTRHVRQAMIAIHAVQEITARKG